jgi:hypothetical protein
MNDPRCKKTLIHKKGHYTEESILASFKIATAR